MNNKEDIWMMKSIFYLSDRALIRMVNRLFQTDYKDQESIRREWKEQDFVSVSVMIGCANRYRFKLRHTDGCLQISAEDRGCVFQYVDAIEHSDIQMKEPQVTYFGNNTKKEYFTTLEFAGHGQVKLPIHTFVLADYSAWKLEEEGLILFLPFLFCCFAKDRGNEWQRQKALKNLVLYDIVGALHKSIRKGDLDVFTAERLKKLCRRMMWKALAQEPWLQNLELLQELSDAFDADIELLERTHQLELQKAQNQQPFNRNK